MATTAIIAAVIGAGASVGGSALSAKSAEDAQVTPGDALQSTLFPERDPLVSQLSSEALLGVGGLRNIDTLRASSPLNQILNEISRSSQFANDTKTVAMRTLTEAVKGGRPFTTLLDARSRPNFGRALTVLQALGYEEDDIRALDEKEAEFNRQMDELEPLLTGVSDRVSKSRLEALGSIADIRSEVANLSERGQLEGEYGRLARGRINDQFGESYQDVLDRAGTAGFNPGRVLGELERSRDLALRDVPRSASLEALALASGLQSTLDPGNNLLQNASAQRIGAIGNASSAAGSQAAAINSIAQQSAANTALARSSAFIGGANSISNAAAQIALAGGGPGGSGNRGGLAGGSYNPNLTGNLNTQFNDPYFFSP